MKITKQKTNGPFLAAALFCETAIESKTGAMSIINVYDSLDLTLTLDAPKDIPSEGNRLPILITIFLSFRTGDASGEHTVGFSIVSPSGKRNEPIEKKELFSVEPNGGRNLVFRLNLMAASVGLFYVDVFLNKKIITRMPLLVKLTRPQAIEDPTLAIQGIDKKALKKPSKP
ncbi:MAG TPA: hypothetical protein VGJ05_06380 [Fimbriiglobus sp.]|jgi:hypothetical protein